MGKEADWLLRELPTLVERGVLDAPAAHRLREHYARAGGAGPSWGTILLAIGGSVLVGLGIILIFAHNWEDRTPGVRAVLSMLPLLAGQLACVHALKTGSRAWREGAGLFTALAIGAAIALVAQTYQFGGDLPRFLLTWTLLALPLVYVLDASAVAALCWLGALGWTMADGQGWFSRGETLREVLRLPIFLLLATLPLPHLLRHLRLDAGSARVAWLMRVALSTLVLGYGLSTPSRSFETLLFIYAGMAAVAVLAGRLWFSGTRGLWGNPPVGAGLLGACAIALLATVLELWLDLDLEWNTLLLPAAALATLAVWLAYRDWSRQRSLIAPSLPCSRPYCSCSRPWASPTRGAHPCSRTSTRSRSPRL